MTGRAFLIAVALMAPVQAKAVVNVVGGPVENPANGHQYYLLEQAPWPASEATANLLGGHLATVNDAAENAWLLNTFGSVGGVERHLWIGFNDLETAGTFVWSSGAVGSFVSSSGDTIGFVNWASGEPNSIGTERYGLILRPGLPNGGLWNNGLGDFGLGGPVQGVVEISGEVCWDAIDTDGDGLADDVDPDCRFLQSPMAGTTSSTMPIIAIFDHSRGGSMLRAVETAGAFNGIPGSGYSTDLPEDGLVLAYNGQSGAFGNYPGPTGMDPRCYADGLTQEASSIYLIDINYVQPEPHTNLCYDGHPGVDIALPGPSGDAISFPVLAAADGVIVFQGCVKSGPTYIDSLCGPGESEDSLGNYIAIRHPNGFITYYGHLSAFTTFTEGDPVFAGDHIGESGETGMAGGTIHLHFEVGFGDYSVVDPYGYQGLGDLWVAPATAVPAFDSRSRTILFLSLCFAGFGILRQTGLRYYPVPDGG